MSAPDARTERTAPSPSAAATGRNLAALALRAWRVRVTAAHLVPGRGPVLLAANHAGLLDALVLVGAAPRPVHLLLPSAAFVPPVAGVLRAAGHLEAEPGRPDRSALLGARAILAGGGAVGAFPEGNLGAGDVAHVRHEAAYLAASSGAPVVPVAILGTRPAGAAADSLPRWRTSIDIVFGAPVDIRADGDVHRRAVVARSAERLRQVLADHVRTACRRTGQELPGPLPLRSIA